MEKQAGPAADAVIWFIISCAVAGGVGYAVGRRSCQGEVSERTQKSAERLQEALNDLDAQVPDK